MNGSEIYASKSLKGKLHYHKKHVEFNTQTMKHLLIYKANTVFKATVVIIICALFCNHSHLKAQKKVIGYNFLNLSFAKHVGHGDLFAEDLTKSVVNELELEGFYNIDGITFRNKPRVGFNVNFFFERQIGSRVFLHTELSYSQKGSRYVTNEQFSASYNDAYSGYSHIDCNLKEVFSFKRNYIDIPLMFVLKLKEPANNVSTNMFIMAGPCFSALVTSKTKLRIVIDQEGDQDEWKDYMSSRFDFGTCFGFGIDLKENDNSGFVRLEFRYVLGLINPFKAEQNTGYTFRNQFISTGLVMMFNN